MKPYTEGNQAKTDRVSDVRQEMEHLAKTTEQLLATVARVGDTLGPVLGPDKPTVLDSGNKNPVGRPSMVPLAEQIYVQRDKIDGAVAILNDFMNRCEL